jgi:hypothetical protein
MIPILHAPGCGTQAGIRAREAPARTQQQRTLMIPGQLGPMSRVLFCCSMARFTLTMSCCGMPSVMHTTRSSSASTASMMARAARVQVSGSAGAPQRSARTSERRGHVDHRRVGARRLLGLCDSVEHRQPWARTRVEPLGCARAGPPQRTKVHAAPLLRRDAADHLGAIRDSLRAAVSAACGGASAASARLLRVKGAVLAREALADDLQAADA